jgi:hypothetical protein
MRGCEPSFQTQRRPKPDTVNFDYRQSPDQRLLESEITDKALGNPHDVSRQ